MRGRTKLTILASLLLLAVPFTGAQAELTNDPGVHPYETYDGARENINLATSNLNVRVPLLNLPGRNGLNYGATFVYDSGLTFNSGVWGVTGWTLARPGNISLYASSAVWVTSTIVCLGNFVYKREDGTYLSFPTLRANCQLTVPPYGEQTQYEQLSDSDQGGEGYEADVPLHPPCCDKNLRLDGIVSLQVAFNEKGTVVCVEVLHGHPLAAAAALRSVRSWKFLPYKVKGVPKPAWGTMNIKYQIRDSGSTSSIE